MFKCHPHLQKVWPLQYFLSPDAKQKTATRQRRALDPPQHPAASAKIGYAEASFWLSPPYAAGIPWHTCSFVADSSTPIVAPQIRSITGDRVFCMMLLSQESNGNVVLVALDVLIDLDDGSFMLIYHTLESTAAFSAHQMHSLCVSPRVMPSLLGERLPDVRHPAALILCVASVWYQSCRWAVAPRMCLQPLLNIQQLPPPPPPEDRI